MFSELSGWGERLGMRVQRLERADGYEPGLKVMKGVFLCRRDYTPLCSVCCQKERLMTSFFFFFFKSYRPSILYRKLEAGNRACNSHKPGDKRNPNWAVALSIHSRKPNCSQKKILRDRVRLLLDALEAGD